MILQHSINYYFRLLLFCFMWFQFLLLDVSCYYGSCNAYKFVLYNVCLVSGTEGNSLVVNIVGLIWQLICHHSPGVDFLAIVQWPADLIISQFAVGLTILQMLLCLLQYIVHCWCPQPHCSCVSLWIIHYHSVVVTWVSSSCPLIALWVCRPPLFVLFFQIMVLTDGQSQQ